MKLIRSIKHMSEYSKMLKKQGKTIGFVPTMGYLHEGHLSLMRKAKKETDISVISIFVNPTQFGPKEDYRKYPRDFRRDEGLARSVGVDIVFYPTVSQMYPKGFCTYVSVENLTEGLCGKFRPGHFRGVTTVVAKLFDIVKPDIAYFGQKDAQQAIVIKRMTQDLDMPIKIRILPIIREKDGLAMSSRNVYLNKAERKDATILYKALQKAKKMIKYKIRNPAKIITSIKNTIKGIKSKFKIDYISIVDVNSLKDVKQIKGRILIALAVWMGKTRLIDNEIIRTGR